MHDTAPLVAVYAPKKLSSFSERCYELPYLPYIGQLAAVVVAHAYTAFAS
jgi:hypothetical protein